MTRDMTGGRPPFRADVVGSFLRPARLKAARETLLGPQTPDQHLGPHDNAELRAIEDDCVREVIAMQERAGLQAGDRRRIPPAKLVARSHHGMGRLLGGPRRPVRDGLAQPERRDAKPRRGFG